MDNVLLFKASPTAPGKCGITGTVPVHVWRAGAKRGDHCACGAKTLSIDGAHVLDARAADICDNRRLA